MAVYVLRRLTNRVVTTKIFRAGDAFTRLFINFA